jgi:mannose-1-phosphate guanylyltransferase/mannose-6-phosphate isomerase
MNDGAAFTVALLRSARVAASGNIVILGITPSRPETGFGYLMRAGLEGTNGEYCVAQFTDKPDVQTAVRYLDSDDFAWNSGMFVLKASIWLKALEQFRPDIAQATDAAWAGKTNDVPFVRPHAVAFTRISSESVDDAVMERCPGSQFAIRMVPLGPWDAVWEVGQQDVNGNVTNGDTLLADTTNTLIHASSRLVGTVGVNGLVTIETADAVLVADRSKSQHVKKLVTQLTQQKRAELTLHRKVHRPWGWYDSIDEEHRLKVKRIKVKPKSTLSLQMHRHRAEHWIVVSGTADVTCSSKVTLLTENQSIYIPQGETHRLANPGVILLEIIEVQSGSYLGEDDLVRFEDTYGRAKE